MSATGSGSSTRAQDDSARLLGPFVDVLLSTRPATIPADTLLGAVTHFLSSCSRRDLPRISHAIIESPLLWNGTLPHPRIREAIALAVEGKIHRLNERLGDRWCIDRRVSAGARQWLSLILDHLTMKEERAASAVLHFRLGLLTGMGRCTDVQWKRERVELEEQTMRTVAQIKPGPGNTSTTNTALDDMDIWCQAIEVVSPERLQVLDLKALLHRLRRSILDQARSIGPVSATSPAGMLSRALARLVPIAANGTDKQLEDCFDTMASFLRDVQEEADSQTLREDRKGKLKDHEVARKKSLLSAFLLPASSLVDVLLEHRRPLGCSTAESHWNDLPAVIISTLASLSSSTDGAEGGVEAYDRVLHGSLDLLASRSSRSHIRRLFERMHLGADDPVRAAFILRCGELLVNKVDAYTVTQVLVPLCQLHLRDYSHGKGYDAAHAFLLALIKSIGHSDERPLPQQAFGLEVVPYYADVLVRQHQKGLVSDETFADSYLAILELASKLHSGILDDMMGRLMSYVAPSGGHANNQIALATAIVAAQYLPGSRLRPHLDMIAEHIITMPVGEKRLDIVAKVFSMIKQDLGDDKKSLGIDWWAKWKDRLLKIRNGAATARARL